MTLTVTHELNICHDCACLIANGESNPEHDDAATATAMATYGDLLRDLSLSCSDCEDECGTDGFECDYCGQDVYSYRHAAVILGKA